MQPFPPSSNLRCQVTNHLHPHHIRTLEDCFHPLLSSESTKEGRKGHQQKGFPLESGAFSWNSIRILPCNDGYPPGNDHISPKNGILKMIILFPRWDMLVPWRVVLTCFEVLNSNLKRTKSNTHLAFKKDQNHFESALQPMDTSCQRIFPLNEVLTALLNCRNFRLVVFQLWRSWDFYGPWNSTNTVAQRTWIWRARCCPLAYSFESLPGMGFTALPGNEVENQPP